MLAGRACLSELGGVGDALWKGLSQVKEEPIDLVEIKEEQCESVLVYVKRERDGRPENGGLQRRRGRRGRSAEVANARDSGAGPPTTDGTVNGDHDHDLSGAAKRKARASVANAAATKKPKLKKKRAVPKKPATRKVRKDRRTEGKGRKTWSVGRYPCQNCDAVFPGIAGLQDHQQEAHSDLRPYVCKVCGKCFRYSCVLTNHMRTHSGERPFACQLCPKRFTQNASYRAHQRIHNGEKPFSCGVCGWRFARTCDMNRHVSTHTDEKLYSCTECGECRAPPRSVCLR